MDIILIGSGGCMRELAWQMFEQNRVEEKWQIIGYVDKERPVNGCGISVGKKIIPYLGNDDYFNLIKNDVNVVISVGKSRDRRRIANKLLKYPHLQFPNIIINNTYVCEDVKLGRGCIISMDCKISTNVVFGDFVFLNMGSMVCHDGKIEDFVSLSPDVKLAGAVSIGKNTDVGMGTKVIQDVHLGSDVIVGAGCVIVKDIESACTVVGVPAKKIRG